MVYEKVFPLKMGIAKKKFLSVNRTNITWKFNQIHQHDDDCVSKLRAPDMHTSSLSFKGITWGQGEHKPKGEVNTGEMET